MPDLIFLSLSNNDLAGEIPASIWETSSLQVLDLSMNNLTGSIPTSIGNCSFLKALDLGNDKLSRKIPDSLGQLSQLQLLHLNDNMLSDELPNSLKNLSSLETWILAITDYLVAFHRGLQVSKIEVQYDKTSKQVDVQALKETLWDHIREINLAAVQAKEQEEEKISFKQVLAAFPNDCRASSSVQDISPHLCFICLLHLANEHGLWIQGSANLDDLSIHL